MSGRRTIIVSYLKHRKYVLFSLHERMQPARFACIQGKWCMLQVLDFGSTPDIAFRKLDLCPLPLSLCSPSKNLHSRCKMSCGAATGKPLAVCILARITAVVTTEEAYPAGTPARSSTRQVTTVLRAERARFPLRKSLCLCSWPYMVVYAAAARQGWQTSCVSNQVCCHTSTTVLCAMLPKLFWRVSCMTKHCPQ